MLLESGADECRVKEVIDGADHEASPTREYYRLDPVAGERQIYGNGDPDQISTDSGDDGHQRRQQSKQKCALYAEGPEGKGRQQPLNRRDNEATQRDGVDCVTAPIQDQVGFGLGQWKDGSQ